jgi:subtilisin family serine protease
MNVKSAAALILLAVLVLNSVFSVAQAPRPEVAAPGAAGSEAISPDAKGLGFAADRVLVRFRAEVPPQLAQRRSGDGLRLGSSLASLDHALMQAGVLDARPLFGTLAASATQEPSGIGRIFAMRLRPGSDVLRAVAQLAADPTVEWAEPDYLAHAVDTTPDDPLFGEQWGLAKIEAPAAWDRSTGAESTVIAVLDSGVDAAHPDLAARIWTNPADNSVNGIDEDGNGLVDDVHGWNFVAEDNDVGDNNGHGTQVAGVAAATGNNGVGIAGVCWACRVMPVKVMQDRGVANYSDIAQGVTYAADKGAGVINLSLGGYADSSALRAAVAYAVGKGSVVVGGAGNEDKRTPLYPAAYPGVLAVAGSTQADGKAGFSNYGAWVDLTAPAAAIQTTLSGGGYGPIEGTSVAAPFVAGTAGLLRSRYPGWEGALVRAQLLQTADDIDAANPGFAGLLGSGRLNAAAALSTPPAPSLSVSGYTVDGADAHPEPGDSFALVVTLQNAWGPASALAGTLSTSDPYATVEDGAGGFGNAGAGGTVANAADPFQVKLAADTPYAREILFTLGLSGVGGYDSELALIVTVHSGYEHLPGGTVLTSDATWTADKTYVLDGNVVVGENATLTIEPGTTVEVAAAGAWMRVDGTLVASGTVAAPISFVAAAENITVTWAPRWAGLRFGAKSQPTVLDGEGRYLSGSILTHVRVEDAQSGVGVSGTELYVGDSVFESNGTGISVVENGKVTVRRGRLVGNDVGVGGSSGRVEVAGSEILDGDRGLALEQSRLTLTGSTISGNRIGITGWNSSSGSNDLRENVITDNTEQGVNLAGDVTFQYNLVANNGVGVHLELDSDGSTQVVPAVADGETDPKVSLAASAGAGVRYNTIISNAGNGLEVSGSYAGLFAYDHNNLFGNSSYDLYLSTPEDILAGESYWGEIPSSQVPGRIYDCHDLEFGCPDASLGQVTYQPLAAGPIGEAPAFVRSIGVDPPVAGIEQATFDVAFSRPMDQGVDPQVSFHLAKRWTGTIFTEADGLADNRVAVIEADREGNLWFGGGFGGKGVSTYDGEMWRIYDTNNSGIAENAVYAIYADRDDRIWFAHQHAISAFDGAHWTVYTWPDEIGVNGPIVSIAQTSDGIMWFANDDDGLLRFDGANWTHYTIDNGLPFDYIHFTAGDQHGNLWIAGAYSMAIYDGNTWTAFRLSEVRGGDALYGDLIASFLVDSRDRVWVPGASGDGSTYFISRFENGEWETYDAQSVSELEGCGFAAELWSRDRIVAEDRSGDIWFACYPFVRYSDGEWQRQAMEDNHIPSGVRAMAFDAKDNLWTNWGSDGGAFVAWGGDDYPVTDNAEWLDDAHFRATYDVNTLVPQGEYAVTVSGARSASVVMSGTLPVALPAGGMPIPKTTQPSFSVAYAGAAADTTAPAAPSVRPDVCRNSTTSAAASWIASDPDSAITLYRYALGTSKDGTEVLSWTDTSKSAQTFTELSLARGQHYYFSVRARNAGGLWSPSGYGGFVAGVPCQRVFLPIGARNR